MTHAYSPAYLVGLVRELCKQPHETEWIEFKRNNDNPEELGEYICALANSAALCGKAAGYLLWGIDDDTHRIVGTTVNPTRERKGNEELESWLLRLLTPRIAFSFFEVPTEDGRVVLLEVQRATRQPVQFQGQEFIRVGSYKKKLKEFPEKERELWRLFDATPFEAGIALEHVTTAQVLELLDARSMCSLTGAPVPPTVEGMVDALRREQLVATCPAGGWNITNLGAILFAQRLDDFPTLKRKAVRVVHYAGANRLTAIREHGSPRGYAAGFEELLRTILALLQPREVIDDDGIRRNQHMVPALAIREVVANALIHQDFSVTGAGPMVEVFGNRVEVTNPGLPLVGADRFLDSPPRSRNENLASFMRRIGICEERGSGVDKIVSVTEAFHLPAPLFETVSNQDTRVVLFGPKPLADMDKAERVRACYLHAGLKFVSRDFLTNSSLRKRFGIEEQNKATVSRYIREAVDEGAIVPFDAAAAPKLMKYAPWWATLSRPPAGPGSS